MPLPLPALALLPAALGPVPDVADVEPAVAAAPPNCAALPAVLVEPAVAVSLVLLPLSQAELKAAANKAKVENAAVNCTVVR